MREEMTPGTTDAGFQFPLYIPNNHVMVKKVGNWGAGNERVYVRRNHHR